MCREGVGVGGQRCLGRKYAFCCKVLGVLGWERAYGFD